MYAKKLIEIATGIGTISSEIKKLEFLRDTVKDRLDDFKTVLCPSDGWPGKNEGERKISMEKVFMTEPTCMELNNQLKQVMEQIMNLSADYILLEAERRGYEFAVRDGMATAMGAFKQAEELDAMQDIVTLEYDSTADDMEKLEEIIDAEKDILSDDLDEADRQAEIPTLPVFYPTEVKAKAPVRVESPKKKLTVADAMSDLGY